METDKTLSIIGQILLEDWDPIGIKKFSEASDEYDSYATDIAQMVYRGANRNTIFEYLRKIETEHMGIPGDEVITDTVAKKIESLGK